MPKNVENRILEHLWAMRAAVDRVEQQLDDKTTRIGHLETSFTHMQTSLAHVQVQPGEQSVRFDRVEARLARIEKRLELADALGVPGQSGPGP
jgi:hypothetical protein